MSRYVAEHYSNRREYLNWLAKVYGVDRAGAYVQHDVAAQQLILMDHGKDPPWS